MRLGGSHTLQATVAAAATLQTALQWVNTEGPYLQHSRVAVHSHAIVAINAAQQHTRSTCVQRKCAQQRHDRKRARHSQRLRTRGTAAQRFLHSPFCRDRLLLTPATPGIVSCLVGIALVDSCPAYGSHHD